MLEKDMSHPTFFITFVMLINELQKYPVHIPPYIGVATKIWGFTGSFTFLAATFVDAFFTTNPPFAMINP